MTKSDAIHENITRCFNRLITKPETNPQSFTEGLTYLLPKSNETNISKNYGPMTCVSEMYKILTSIVTKRIYNFLNANNIPPSEKREYRKGFYGCKGQLLISKMLLENTRCPLKKCSQLKSGSCFYLICFKEEKVGTFDIFFFFDELITFAGSYCSERQYFSKDYKMIYILS